MTVINFGNASVVVSQITFFQRVENGWKMHLTSGHNLVLSDEEKEQVVKVINQI